MIKISLQCFTSLEVVASQYIYYELYKLFFKTCRFQAEQTTNIEQENFSFLWTEYLTSWENWQRKQKTSEKMNPGGHTVGQRTGLSSNFVKTLNR